MRGRKLDGALRDDVAVVLDGAYEVVHTVDLLHVDGDYQSVGVLLLTRGQRVNLFDSLLGDLITLGTFAALTWDLNWLDLASGEHQLGVSREHGRYLVVLVLVLVVQSGEGTECEVTRSAIVEALLCELVAARVNKPYCDVVISIKALNFSPE